MSYFTDVFHALDHDNKGYILFDDFKNEIVKFLHKNETEAISNIDMKQEKAFTQFLSLIKQSDDKKIYFNEFINAINKLNAGDLVNADNYNGETGEYNNFPTCASTDCSPFINDGDNYSTGDSGFDNELRLEREFSNNYIGKENRKRIKAVQNHDFVHNGDTLRRRLSQNESPRLDDTDLSSNIFNKNSFSDLPQTDSKSNINFKRRQSDFVTCASNRLSKNHRYDRDDDEVRSFGGWTPCSGSATDLYYHDSMNDIRTKLEKLEQSMDNLQVSTTESKHCKRRWVEENQYLKTQIHTLEDTLKHQKKQFDRNLNTEIESFRKSLNKLDQTKQDDLDLANQRLKVKERELDDVRKELDVTLGECEKLKYDKLRSEDKLGDLQQQMNFIEEDMKRLKDFHSRELELLTRERNRLLSNAKSAGSSLDGEKQSLKTSANSQQLQIEMSKLRAENRDLKLKLEDCEEEFLAFSIQQGQNILHSIEIDNTWMAEVDGYSKREVIDLLVKEKDANFRLREYVTSILTRIIERDPSLLEIS